MTLPTPTPSAGLRDARASEHPHPAAGVHCLSIVHNASNPIGSPSEAPKPPTKKKRTFKVWKEGSLAYFPGIPNCNPLAGNNLPPVGGIRGKVTTLSNASRRNLRNFIQTMKRDAEGYTSVLTLPGDFEAIPVATVHQCFKILCNRFTASKLFPDVSFIWKRELQKRGALHYHLLIYGVADDATRNDFHRWLANQWNALICISLPNEEKAKHLRWHQNAKNMEKVRGCIGGYFAKYLGKAETEMHGEIPGRWWGKVNGKALPVSKCYEIPAPQWVAVRAHRIARKLRQKQADAAKHRAVAIACGLMGCNGQPIFSQFAILSMKQGHHPKDERGSLFAAIPAYMAEQRGVRWGKARAHKATKYAGIHLISKESPQTAQLILKYAADLFIR